MEPPLPQDGAHGVLKLQLFKSGVFHPSIDPAHRRPDWAVIIAFIALHVGCLAAPFTFTWSSLFLALGLIWLCAGIGITLCYHRLLTHRSFHTPKWFEYVLTVIGTLNWQGGPIKWVGVHRLHHRDSDLPGDPHSPNNGFNWAHIGWMLYKDHDDFKPREAAKDLMRDKVTKWLDDYFFLPQFALVAILYGIGYSIDRAPFGLGFSFVIWGVCVRTVVVYHGTWLVNSASHIWGYRNFETTDQSRNNWWVAVLSFGEGWHNNHHAYQRSAAHGLRWWELDMTYLTIRFLAMFGLATKVVVPEAEVPRSRLLRIRDRVAARATERRIRHLDPTPLSWTQRILQLLAVRS